MVPSPSTFKHLFNPDFHTNTPSSEYGRGTGFVSFTSFTSFTMSCLTRYIEEALTLDGTLSPKAEKQRRILFRYATGALLFTVVAYLSVLDSMTTHHTRRGAYICMAVVLFSIICMILAKRELSTAFVVCSVYIQCAAICLWDLNGRSEASPRWPILVLEIDIMLILQVPARCTTGLVCCCVVWLVLCAFEESFRFGLLDLPGLVPQEGEFGRQEYWRKVTDCDDLPCAVGFPPSSLALGVSVFVLDFIVTRGFARDVLKEEQAMQRTINAVQEIASLLARYDVDEVARMLDAQETLLPEEMHATLRKMEGNLRKYRPYLPAALFEEEDEMCGAQHATVAPPGLDSERATIVFTDILQSTSIWEAAPDGMRAGLRIHNTVIRDVMHTFGGYEVKTIGDAFMIAFATTQDGMDFALKVHERLREAEWPPSLMEDAPICAEQGLLWCGLTVRIGINTGPVTVEQSSLTGRTDYFGHTVNVASRLENTCTPGAVALRSDLWSSDCSTCDAVLGNTESLDLKGVSGATMVCCAWPTALAGRRIQPLIDSMTESTLGKPRSLPASLHDYESRAVSHQPKDSVVPAFATCGPAKPFDATVGVLELRVGEDMNLAALRIMSSGLSTLTIALDQSGGTLVSVLGSYVCVGWNLTRASPSHMEAAIHFAQRMHETYCLSGAGFVSGVVQHGDVGARKQRFVTVMGSTVRRSWTLCEEAVRCGNVCLYVPPPGAEVPSVLADVLLLDRARAGVYKILGVASF